MGSQANYELDPKGHEWRKDDDGSIDIFGLDYEFHNGPICVKCYYSFCEHCLRGEIEECTGEADPPSYDLIDMDRS